MAEVDGNYVLAINQSGIQVVEEFVLARYWMFIQVYFHKDRRLFDYYLSSFMKEYLLLHVDMTGLYPENLERYLELNDSKIDCAIEYYAKHHPDAKTERIHYFADRLFSRKHHKVVFNPPYAHYNEKSGEEREDYRRLAYVNKHIKKMRKGPDDRSIYVDLAAGGTAKNTFNVKFYNDEQSPDIQSSEISSHLLPAIPVVTKHSNSPCPIQDYSFTLRSISDRMIGILRIYAEGDVDVIQQECERLFTEGFTNHMAALEKKQTELKQLKERERSLTAEIEEMKGEIP